jgi:DeoR/GlpR family transcriptional regulator of sugar metabolism
LIDRFESAIVSIRKIMAIDRDDIVLQLLSSQGQITVAEMVQRFAISEVTARKDLARLELEGKAIRTRGGALPARTVGFRKPVDERATEEWEAKHAIAQAAAALVKDGDTIFIDSGTTCLALVSALHASRLRIISHSFPILAHFTQEQDVVIHALGGEYQAQGRCFSGPATIADAGRYSTDIAFVGSSGIDLDGACSAQNPAEAEIKRTALARARKRVLLIDSRKVGAASFAVFAGPGDIDLIITDGDLSEKLAERLRSLGTELLLAPVPPENPNRKEH